MERLEQAMRAGPFSVVHKKATPPSGNKHDYMSLGTYWWPDPDQPDGLPYIRRDGRRNPAAFSDRVDYSAMVDMSKTVGTLASTYSKTQHTRYADRAAMLLRVWFLDPETKMNPHLRYAQAIPGRVDGRGIGIIDTSKLITVVKAIDELGNHIEKERPGLVTWFDQYLDWMLTSEHGQNEDNTLNNHGTWYDVQVVTYALFVDKPEIARRVLEAAKTKRICAQIEPNGSQPLELKRTKSAMYSIMNLRGMIQLANYGDQLGVDLTHYESDTGRSIRAAIDFLAPYADSNKKWPYEQITRFNRRSLLPLLEFARENYGKESYEDFIAMLR